jgi:multidrug efflux pump subunit AcrA (membrane-fusion protein)
MVVETKVRETDVHKVDRNQSVEVRVDAYPELRLRGRVTLVGTLAQEERERRGAKFFAVTVEVDDSDQRLRPGMTAQVEIRVEERAHALSVPLEAVFRKDGTALCYVREGWGFHPREVVLGASNEHFVVIEKGLRPGDTVSLRDPVAETARSAVPGS